MVGAQRVRHRRQLEGAVRARGEHTVARQQAQHPAERVRVRTDPPGELVGGQRTLGERLGHLQFGGDVHRTRDHDTHDQFQQSERRRREFPALPLQIRSCFLRFPYDVRRRQFGHEFPPWQERKSLSQPPEGTGTTTIWKKVDASWRETRIPLVYGFTHFFLRKI